MGLPGPGCIAIQSDDTPELRPMDGLSLASRCRILTATGHRAIDIDSDGHLTQGRSQVGDRPAGSACSIGESDIL